MNFVGLFRVLPSSNDHSTRFYPREKGVFGGTGERMPKGEGQCNAKAKPIPGQCQTHHQNTTPQNPKTPKHQNTKTQTQPSCLDLRPLRMDPVETKILLALDFITTPSTIVGLMKYVPRNHRRVKIFYGSKCRGRLHEGRF